MGMRIEVYRSFPINFAFPRKCDRCGNVGRFLGGWRIITGKWEFFACRRCTEFEADAWKWFHEAYPADKPKCPPPPPQGNSGAAVGRTEKEIKENKKMSRAARIEYEKLGPLSEKEKALAKLPIVIRNGELHVLTPDGSTKLLKEAYKEV